MKSALAIVLILLGACTSTRQSSSMNPNSLVVDGKVFTTLFQQRAAEYRALCYQAYNVARFRLDEALITERAKRPAIITDIDETVLDNSVYAAKRALKGKDYEASSWTSYINLAIADTIPGALSFLKYAASRGVEIFYITNREQHERKGTLANLQKFGFPFADSTHLFAKQETSGKEARRQRVMTNNEVVLLLGDNLSDFSFLFDKKTVEQRMNSTDAVSTHFGNRFIVLPNPVYGDWELGMYKYNYNLTPAQKDSVLKSWLKAY
jgi:5'-nucleotidase (lipoprotein e(P4) family)